MPGRVTIITNKRHAEDSLRSNLYFPPISAKLIIYQQKGSPMLATALALQEATQNAIFDDESIDMARNLTQMRNVVADEEFMKLVFMYSCHLSAVTATLATEVLLTKSQLDEMMNSIREMDALGKDIQNGNND